MIVYPVFIRNWVRKSRPSTNDHPAGKWLKRPPLSELAQDPSQLPPFVADCPVARKYLTLLEPLDWANFPERNPRRAWPGPQPLARAPFVAAYLVKLHEGKTYMSELRQYLLEHPALVWLLGFPLAPSSNYPWGFDLEATIPTARQFLAVLRQLDNDALQFLLDNTVQRLQQELPPELNFGQIVAFDTKHILAWVAENNPKTFIPHGRYDKNRQPKADPDCRLGVKKRRNQSTKAGRPAQVQLLLDGTQSNSATVAQGYAERIVQEYAIAAAGNIRLAIDLRARAWFNPDLLSRNYNVPAVAGTIVFLMSLILTALAVVREREIGTLEQLMVSPLTPFELIGGKTIPFALFAFIDVLLVTGAALFWFDVPFVGSLWQLMLASLLFILSGLGVGLLISTVSKTQQQAFLTTFLVFMPIMLLSGFMFPVNSMPKIFQWLTLINPMRHYLEIVRSIFLKGAGIAPLWHQYAVLTVLGIVTLIFAASRFRKVAG